MAKYRYKMDKHARRVARNASRIAGRRLPREAVDLGCALEAVYAKRSPDPTAVQPDPGIGEAARRRRMEEEARHAACVVVAVVYASLFCLVAVAYIIYHFFFSR